MRIRRSYLLLLAALCLAGCDDSSDAPVETGALYDLVFEGWPDGQPELMVRNADSGEVERLFPAGTVAMDPSPSPDGRSVAFVVANYDDAIGDIFVANRDGSGVRPVADEEELDDQPAWSPDGTRIAFRSYRTQRDGDIWVVDADGGNPRQLTFDPLPAVTDEARPTWSPDGTQIAYASNAINGWDIWVMGDDGSNPRRLTESPLFESEPAWSPDGASIVFRRNDPAESELYVVPAAGGEAIPLAIAGFQRTPIHSADGMRLVYIQQSSLAGRPDVYVAGADGSDPQPLVTDEVAGGCWNPAWLRRPGTGVTAPRGIVRP